MEIIEYTNPINLSAGQVVHDTGELSAGDWLRARYGNRPESVTIVAVNGRAVSDWLSIEDIDPAFDVRVMIRPGTPVQWIQGIAAVISVATAYLNRPQSVTIGEEQSQTYSIRGQQNLARLGAGVPIHYGKVRVFPDLISQGYQQYAGNEQFLYQLFCIGLGEYDFEALHIDDTDVSAFEEVEYEYYHNAPVTLFPVDVESSVEPANQELSPTPVGAFIANATTTLANRLEIDVAFTAGLYRARSSGDIDLVSVTIIADYQEIDDAGVPIGAPVEFINETVTDNITRPLRLTFGATVPDGRYEVSVRRTDTQTQGPKTFSRVVWEGMRAFLVDGAQTYADMTVLAVKAKATGNLNQISRSLFNVVATRKLEAWNGSSWDAPAATQSIAWALADLVRNQYIGNRPDTQLDITTLAALDTTWTTRGDLFDFRFDIEYTLWDALNLVARAGRAYPILTPDYCTFIRTAAETVPATVYNRNTMLPNSFQVEYRFRDDGDFDSVLAEFVDPLNNWQPSVILCQPPGSAAAKPKRILYNGVTTREQAFREGIYDAEVELSQRKAIRFRTEGEGYIPQRGSLIKVANEDHNFDQGGELVAVAGVVLTLSDEVVFTPALSHSIIIRKTNGEVAGPYIATEEPAANQIRLNSALPFSPSLGTDMEAAKYLFGVVGSVKSDWVVAEIKPLGGLLTEVIAVNNAPTVHTVDLATPPATNTPVPLLNTPGAPVILTLLVERGATPGTVSIAWSPAPGAEFYTVQKSLDGGVTWVTEGFTANTFYTMLAPPGTIYIRVGARGAVRGPWIEWNGEINSYVLNSPTNLTLTNELIRTESGEYVSGIVFEFTGPPDDYLVTTFEAQYKLARYNDWEPLFNALETRHVLQIGELGIHDFRVRSVYVPDEVFSSWAEAQITNLGTYTQLATIGLDPPDNPELFITTDLANSNTAAIRVTANYIEDPNKIAPEFFVLYYAAEERPNTLTVSSDTSSKLYLETTGIAGEFTLSVTAGSTDKIIQYTDPSGLIDIDLSGMWWARVRRAAGSPETKFHKVAQSSSTQIYIPEGETLDFTPAAGDFLDIVELDWHDSRLPEFKLAYVEGTGEIINHGGIQYDGAYYLEAVTRGAEGTSEADATGLTLHYYPAPGPDTNFIEISAAQFTFISGTQVAHSGHYDLNIPSVINWASVSCSLVRRAVSGTTSAYVRSVIVPLTVGGPA